MIKVTYNISNWSLSFKFSWSLEIKESDRIGILNNAEERFEIMLTQFKEESSYL